MAPIRIFSLSSEGYEVDTAALEALADRKDLQNLEVVVISVAGRFREGKSFILNFMLRYLKHVSRDEKGDWLKYDEVLSGFEWKNSLDRVTIGVQIWDEIFKIRRPNGQEVAVVVMDTQGVFDTESSVQEATAIFAFSVLTSSMQVYNLMQNIKGDDLPNLAIFIEYSLLAAANSGDSATKAFQQLVLLIRDWQYAYKYPYGWNGGQMLLQRPIIAENDNMRNIRKSFQDVLCFTLPHPGMTVATSPNFNGKISDINKSFLNSVRQFVEGLLAPSNIVTKKIGGRKVVFSDFCKYVQSYANELMSDEMPTPKGLFDATIEANHEVIRTKALTIYSDAMNLVYPSSGTFVQWTKLNELHVANKERSLNYLKQSYTMGGERAVRNLKNSVEKEIESRYSAIKQKNEIGQFLKVLHENEQKQERLRKLLEEKVARTSDENAKLREELKATETTTGILRLKVEALQKQIQQKAKAAKKSCSIF